MCRAEIANHLTDAAEIASRLANKRFDKCFGGISRTTDHDDSRVSYCVVSVGMFDQVVSISASVTWV